MTIEITIAVLACIGAIFAYFTMWHYKNKLIDV